MRITLAAILALPCAACFPFGVPPGQVTVGTIPTAGREAFVVRDLRAGLNPAQLLPDGYDRPVDVGLGYRVTYDEEKPVGQGAYGEVAALPGTFGNSAVFGRLGLRSVSDLHFSEPTPTSSRHAQFHQSAFLSMEVGTFAAGTFKSKDMIGAAYGETSIGAYAGPTVMWTEHGVATAMMIGVAGRIPAVGGIACCAFP